MQRIVFYNHLRRGSASNERQEGLGKALERLGHRAKFVMRRPMSPPVSDEGEVHPLARSYWTEPMPVKLRANLDLASRAARGADVVHVNRASPYTSGILELARARSRAAMVVDMEDWDGYGGYSSYRGEHGPKGWLLESFERTFPPRADAVVVVSDLLRAHMVALGVKGDRIFKIPNGFDPRLFRPDVDDRPLREKFGNDNGPLLMYASAYWKFERGLHEFALSVFKLVAKSCPEARLLMVGSGDLDVSELVRGLHLDDNVVLTGFVPRSWMPALMKMSDMVFHVISDHPFHRASSPMIVPEYMAMGKAVVAPAVGELQSMLPSGAGVLVRPWDRAEMASQVIRLLRDEPLRSSMGAAASSRARDLYSYDILGEVLSRAYTSAIQTRSARLAGR